MKIEKVKKRFCGSITVDKLPHGARISQYGKSTHGELTCNGQQLKQLKHMRARANVYHSVTTFLFGI